MPTRLDPRLLLEVYKDASYEARAGHNRGRFDKSQMVNPGDPHEYAIMAVAHEVYETVRGNVQPAPKVVSDLELLNAFMDALPEELNELDEDGWKAAQITALRSAIEYAVDPDGAVRETLSGTPMTKYWTGTGNVTGQLTYNTPSFLTRIRP